VLLDVAIDAELPPVHGDTSALQLILRNLVENALRHGDREPMRIDVRAGRGRHGVEVQVRDHGAGYAGDFAKLGHMFERGDASRGTGVGLYLVRVLMERMGGSVEFANAQGGGFAVTLLFPTDS
jgi:signal transduction histidine kinase